MLKRIAALLLVTLTLIVTGCSVSPTGGLKSFADSYDGYQFLYPNSWVEMDASRIEPDVIFRDLIEVSENVSVIINPIPGEKTLAELGTPTEVGYKLSKMAIAPPDSNREAELVNAEQREFDGKTYYMFEYAVKLPNQLRHNLASIAISRGQLFTLNISTTEKRWEDAKDKLKAVANSFHVY
jgi:photosystem II oxygen-evolving enhancer protein 2